MKLITFLQTWVATHELREDREEGAAMVEYGMLLAGIAVVVYVAVKALGTRIIALFNGITF